MGTDPPPTVRGLLRINRVCDEFEALCRAGECPRLEDFVTRPAADAALLEHLIPIDAAYRRRRGESPDPDDYAVRFPDLDRGRLAELLAPTGEEPFPSALGEYDVVRPIGSGGMGVVYLARHRRMARLVALKAVPPDSPDREELSQRFAREVAVTARLSHPNVVAAFDAREDAGVRYLVTEYVGGGDLGRLVRRSGPLPVPDAVRLARGAALGLGHAHARAIIHRDVKPSNLLVTDDGRVCVGDWGLARTQADDPAIPSLTASGTVLGTVDYLAPEQAGRSDAADARSDVYSLGCVLFFLLAGRPPFDRGTFWDRIDAHRDDPPPDADTLRPDVPAALAALVARMLAKHPDDRPQDMAAVVAALDAVEPASPSDETHREPRAEQPSRPRLSRRALLWGGVSVAALSAAGIAAWYAATRRKAAPPPDKPDTPPKAQPKPQPKARGAPPIAEMPFADPAGYQRRWADHLGLPVERVDAVDGVEFRFLLVPPGTFRMGSPDDLIARLLERLKPDDPQRAFYLAEKERPVTIRRAFYLGKTEVTHAQFGLFMRRTPYQTRAERAGKGLGYHGPKEGWRMGPGFNWKSAGSYTPAPDHLVVNTTWSDAAVAFCGWLSAETGGTCRLPAESEWEFACRGGQYGRWGHGDDPDALRRFAVYGVRLPAPVGTREPNGFGLFDMHGNASERCAVEDRWAADPARPADLGKAVYPVRGGRHNEVQPGAVDTWPDAYRAARRTWEAEGSLTAGFRVLREIPG